MTAGRDDSTRPSIVRILTLLAVAASVGGALAAVKGSGYNLAYLLGNASAPYLVIAFFVGRACRARRAAAVMGVVTTFVALTAFYWTASTLYLGRLSINFSIGRWFLIGTVSGAVLGAIGFYSRAQRWLFLVPPGVLFLEPIAVYIARLFGLASPPAPSDIVLAAVIEIAVGLVLASALFRSLKGQPSRLPVEAEWLDRPEPD